MKLIRNIFICIVLLMHIGSFTGCGITVSNELSESSMRKYYSKEDFESIIVGKSTFKDVFKIAPSPSMQATSYGGKCEYPAQDGGCICIKFYGKELIVGSIEKIPSSTHTKTSDNSSS